MFKAIFTAAKNGFTIGMLNAELKMYFITDAVVEDFGSEGLKVTVKKLANVQAAETIAARITKKTRVQILVAF